MAELTPTFDLTLNQPLSVGGYDVSTASLRLAQANEATVDFTPCVRGKCVGAFTMTEAYGNPIGVDLTWTQKTSTGHVDTNVLNLSNAAGALGGVERLTGTLVLEQSSPTEGDLRIQVSGSDNFGGSLAEIDIDMTGVVSRWP